MPTGTRTRRGLAVAAATALWLGLAATPAPASPAPTAPASASPAPAASTPDLPAPAASTPASPAGASPVGEPDAGRLQQSVAAVRDLLALAGDQMRPGAEVTPPADGVDPIHAEAAGQPSAAVPATDRGPGCAVRSVAESRFAGFDAQVDQLMQEWGFLTAALAVSDQCATIYDRGYGQVGPWWARNAPAGPVDDLGPATPADTLFQIGGSTKPITAAAIHDLAARGLLSMTDRVFCVPNRPAGCVLTVRLPAGFDQRIGDLTVRDLVAHQGGFDPDRTTDYLFRAWEVRLRRGLAAPPAPRDFAEYMLGLGLDQAPGAGYHHSNLGYLILGLVIEQAGGLPYRDYVYQRLLAPLGIASGDVVLSRTKRPARDPREPAYWCVNQNWGVNVPVSTFAGEAGQRRCYTNGGWVLEAMAAHGGLSMSASAVATFYAHWWNFGNPRTADTYGSFPAGTTVAYSHHGRLAATHTVAARCRNGLNVVLLTNQHAWGAFDWAAAEQRLCQVADDFLAEGIAASR
jgi:CubicO group peptidase (beta-lactamase class C family)